MAVDAALGMATPLGNSGALPESLLRVTRDEAQAALAELVDVDLDVDCPKRDALLMELGSALVILKRLASRPETSDLITDAVFVSISSLEGLMGDSWALAVADAALPAIVKAFTAAWGPTAQSAVLFSGPEAPHGLLESSVPEGWEMVGSHVFRSGAATVSPSHACKHFQALAAGAKLTAHCMGEADGPGRRLQEDVRLPRPAPPSLPQSPTLAAHPLWPWT